jgi:hypothetical protein
MSVLRWFAFVTGSLSLVGAALAGSSCVLANKSIDACVADGACDQAMLGSFLGPGACQSCVESHCASEIATCGGEQACCKFTSCVSRCEQGAVHSPGCVWACGAFPYAISPTQADGKIEPTNGLFSCATKFCRDECSIGTDYSCVGKHAWPSPTELSVKVNELIQYIPSLTAQNPLPIGKGTTLTACPLDVAPEMCTGPQFPSFQTDSASLLTLDLAPKVGHFSELVAWTGYWKVSGDVAKIPPTLFYRKKPEWMNRCDAEPIPIPGSDVLLPGVAVAAGAVSDCRGLYGTSRFAAGIRVQVLDAQGKPAAQKVSYLNDDQSAPDDTLTATSKSGAFLVFNLDDGIWQFKMTTPDNKPYALLKMHMRKGTTTMLGIWPAAVGEEL